MTTADDPRFTRALQLLSAPGKLVDATTIADALWLARALPAVVAPLPTPPPLPSPPPDSDQSPPPPNQPDGMVTKQTSAQSASPDAGLFAPETPKGDESDLAATAVPVPAGRALPDKLQLERALKPFLRKFPSRRVRVFDEEATAEATAQIGVKSQIALRFRPALERWFDVNLVIEQGPGMDVWADTLLELEQLFSRHGGFRRARSLRYQTAAGTVQLFTSQGTPTPQGVLTDPEGRSLVVIVTNGTSVTWNAPVMVEFVRRLGTRGVAGILRTIPKRMWPFTALGDTAEWVRTHEIAARNSQIEAEDPFTGLWERASQADLVPMFTLEAGRLLTWARFVQSPRRLQHEAVRLVAQPAQPQPPKTATPAPTPEQLVRDFAAKASPQAFQLLRYLAGAPLTLPIMRLVQEALPGAKQQVHLAEVMLSGLIERVTPPVPPVKVDRVFYEFVPGVREFLLDRHSGMERLMIESSLSPMQDRLRRFVEEKNEKAVKDFRALLLDPEGTELLPQSARTVVEISRRVYQRWTSGNWPSVSQNKPRASQLQDESTSDSPAPAREAPASSTDSPAIQFIRLGNSSSSVIVFLTGHDDSPTEWGKFPSCLAGPDILPDWSICTLALGRSLNAGLRGFQISPPKMSDLYSKLSLALTAQSLANCTQLAFCAHSAGGVILQRFLLDFPSLAARISHVFLFGTPSAGLRKSALAHVFSPGEDFLSSEGEFIRRLRADWQNRFGSNPPFAVYAIAGERDEFIPPSSSLDPFPSSQRRVIPGNHLTLIQPDDANSPAVRLIIGALEAVWFNRGYQSTDPHEQIAAYTEAIRRNPKDALSFFNRAIAHTELGGLSDALADYNTAAALNPADSDIFMNRAMVHSDLGNLDAALADYNTALSLAPNIPEILLNRGVCHSEMGNLAAALDDYSAAIAHQPDYADAFFNRADIRIDLGDLDAASADLSLYRKLHADDVDTARALNKLAEAYRIRGSFSAAEPLLRDALTLAEKSSAPLVLAETRNSLGMVLMGQGKIAESLDYFRAALSVWETQLPESAELARAVNNLGEAHRLMGDFPQAEQLLRRAIAINEKVFGPDSLPVALNCNNLGLAYLVSGRFTEAEPLFERAIAVMRSHLAPVDLLIAKLLGNLALAYSQLGKSEQADETFGEAVHIYESSQPVHPDIAQVLSGWADLNRMKGEFDRAEALYQRALAIIESNSGAGHPNTAITLNNLAMLYTGRQRYDEAATYYQRALKIEESTLGPDHPQTTTIRANIDRNNLLRTGGPIDVFAAFSSADAAEVSPIIVELQSRGLTVLWLASNAAELARCQSLVLFGGHALETPPFPFSGPRIGVLLPSAPSAASLEAFGTAKILDFRSPNSISIDQLIAAIAPKLDHKT